MKKFFASIVVLMLMGCGSESTANVSVPMQSQGKLTGVWAEHLADCDGGYDSLLLRADGSATGWEMGGSWRAVGNDAEIRWTSEGLDQGGERIDERSSLALSPDGQTLSLNGMSLTRCPDVSDDTASLALAAPPAGGSDAVVPPNRSDTFPMQYSYRYQVATLMTLTGKGTSNAVATGRVLAQDADVYCDADPDGDAAVKGPDACIRSVLEREEGSTYRASADCQRGSLEAPWSISYERRGDEWVEADTGEVALGMASGAASLPLLFTLLCE